MICSDDSILMYMGVGVKEENYWNNLCAVC